MVWQYRTILFEFTKDGLLGDRYVDDEEMEKTLNLMGQECWELVDVSLLQDGLLAFLKKPVAEKGRTTGPRMEEEVEFPQTQHPVVPQKREASALEQETRSPLNRPPISNRPSTVAEPFQEEEPMPRKSFDRAGRTRREQEDNDFVGGIRIR
nr:DUF4177 domain-containing protein [uncultured Desulfobulbus sp.]